MASANPRIALEAALDPFSASIKAASDAFELNTYAVTFLMSSTLLKLLRSSAVIDSPEPSFSSRISLTFVPSSDGAVSSSKLNPEKVSATSADCWSNSLSSAAENLEISRSTKRPLACCSSFSFSSQKNGH